ncbi:hypothetical protein [Streptomyces xanthophaeus]|uniref:hypothetical protein n=1 Tax=Streptomyces xanthophaeus TaxID=67385 RepID=UPI00233ECAC1|nr:hypothetical protein [Streptomyces xanthophaeus]
MSGTFRPGRPAAVEFRSAPGAGPEGSPVGVIYDGHAVDGPDRHDVVVEALDASAGGSHGVLHGLDARSGAPTTRVRGNLLRVYADGPAGLVRPARPA